MKSIRTPIQRDVKALQRQLQLVFENAQHQDAALVGIYKLFIPDWENIKQVDWKIFRMVAFHFRRSRTQATVPPQNFYTVWMNMAGILIDVSDGMALGIGTLYGVVLMSNKRLHNRCYPNIAEFLNSFYGSGKNL